MRLARLVLGTTLSLALFACSSPTVVVNNQQAASKEQNTANMVKGFATMSPPSGASSMGPMSSPQAGPTTIPITNVDVYTFTANIDDDPAPETLYWASTGDVVYVWGQFDLVCIDDNGDPTGETGVADFVYEDTSSGYGWMVATDSCGYSTYFGCSADGDAPETCGGCDFNADFVVCTAS
jgi:hypothetical protein